MNAVQNAQVNWRRLVRKYMKPNSLKSYWQIFNSVVPYALSWVVAYYAYQYSALLCLAVAAVAQVFLLRIFIVMHDCGHSSFFKSKKFNSFWGFVCGVITFSPYHQWTSTHHTHHKHSGNLDYRGVGDIDTLTVAEYAKLGKWQKLKYKAVRSPFVFLILGGLYTFLLEHRFTKKNDGFKERMSVHGTNLAILLFGITMSYFTGFGFYVLFQLSVLGLAASAGIFLFYVQHQYEDVYWRGKKDWDHFEASMKGSSYLKLPKVLQWATGNIGFHNIHHLCSSIPNYNLEKAYKENKIFQNCTQLGLKESVRCLFLNLYDTETNRLISFKEYRKRFKK